MFFVIFFFEKINLKAKLKIAWIIKLMNYNSGKYFLFEFKIIFFKKASSLAFEWF